MVDETNLSTIVSWHYGIMTSCLIRCWWSMRTLKNPNWINVMDPTRSLKLSTGIRCQDVTAEILITATYGLEIQRSELVCDRETESKSAHTHTHTSLSLSFFIYIYIYIWSFFVCPHTDSTQNCVVKITTSRFQHVSEQPATLGSDFSSCG